MGELLVNESCMVRAVVVMVLAIVVVVVDIVG
jgi:hypothetical protein